MFKYRKKELVIITFLLALVLVSTYFIYYKFKNSTDIKYDSDTLDVTFHGDKGDRVDFYKVTPVTDSVGLSSKEYSFTIKNNTNKTLEYSINIVDNNEFIQEDYCKDTQIPKNIIKFSIRNEKEDNSIYALNNLINGNVLTRKIKPRDKEKYTMRFWTTRDTNISTGTKLHYHGIIEVVDLGNKVAINY